MQCADCGKENSWMATECEFCKAGEQLEQPAEVGKSVFSELLGCPFCGGDDLTFVQHGGGKDSTHFMLCDNCGARGPWVSTLSAEQAKAAWNVRI